MEQYLNYILLIRNENNLTILTIFFSQLKALIKNFIYKRDKQALLNVLVKFLTQRKCQINNFTISSQTCF